MKRLVCRLLLLLLFSLSLLTFSTPVVAQQQYVGPSRWLNNFLPDHFKSKQQLINIASNYQWRVVFEDRQTENPAKVNQVRILRVNNYRRLVTAAFYHPAQPPDRKGSASWLRGLDLYRGHSRQQFGDLIRGNGWTYTITEYPVRDPEDFGRFNINQVSEVRSHLNASFGDEYTLPSLIDRTEQEIHDLFGASPFILEFEYIETTDVNKTLKVIRQSPQPGRKFRAEQIGNGIKLRITLLRLKPFPIPDLIGKTVAEATQLLAGHPAKIWDQFQRVETKNLALHNRIQRQNPPAKTVIDKFTWLGLTLYQYTGKVTVPYVTSLPRDEAINKLSAIGLTAKVIPLDLVDYVESQSGWSRRYQPADFYRVNGQRVTAGSRVDVGSEIGIEVLTPRTTSLPNLIGQRCDKVSDTIRALWEELGEYGVIVSNEHVSNPAKDNTILRTTPSPGARIQTAGRLKAVCGRTTDLIPNLLGKTEAEARAALAKLGVSKISSGYYPSSNFPDGQIYNVSPAAGTVITADTRVSLSVSKHTGGIEIPQLTGKTEAAARKILTDLGFKRIVSTYLPDGQNNPADASQRTLLGKIDSVHPAAGRIAYDLAAPLELLITGWAKSLPVEVPNVGSLNEETAVALLKMKGLVPNIRYQVTTNTALAGTVSLKTEPAAYTKVDKGTSVAINIFVLQAKIPSLVHYTEADAITMLANRLLKAQVEYRSIDNKLAADKVVEQQPEKYSLVAPGTTVTLVVNRYSGMTRLPDWFGQLKYRSPDDKDVKVGLDYLITQKKLRQKTHYVDTVLTTLVGKIARTEPTAGIMVKEGSEINIYLYRLLTAIPDVTDRTESEAREILEPLGFAVKVMKTADGTPGKVSFQSHKAGTPPLSAAITLLVGEAAIVPAPSRQASIRLSKTSEEDNNRQKISTFYRLFKEAYETKSESQVMSLISPEWSSSDGTDEMDMEDNLRNMFSIFDEIQYEIFDLSISKAGPDVYNISYSVTIRGEIYDNDLTHEETSEVSEQVIIDSNGTPKIYKTLGGNYWSIQ